MSRVRVTPIAAALVVGLSLSACSGNYSAFDPTDLVMGEMFYTKAKLPGDRKPVFPEGVPGVPEGVPKELVKGNQQAVLEETPTPEPPPAAKPAPKPAAKPVVRPRSYVTQARPQPVQQQQPVQQSNAPWPDANSGQKPQGQPATTNSGMQANWPPPDSTTFSR